MARFVLTMQLKERSIFKKKDERYASVFKSKTEAEKVMNYLYNESRKEANRKDIFIYGYDYHFDSCRIRTVSLNCKIVMIDMRILEEEDASDILKIVE